MIFKVETAQGDGWRMYDNISEIITYFKTVRLAGKNEEDPPKKKDIVVHYPKPGLNDPYPKEPNKEDVIHKHFYECKVILVPQNFNREEDRLRMVWFWLRNGTPLRIAYTGRAFILNDEGKTIEKI